MRKLELHAITIDYEELRQAEERYRFDELGWEMLARAGQTVEQVLDSVRRATATSGLNRDQAVVGGLLVRIYKLLRGVFDATQADESEAHLPLSRCALESAITLRWLVRRGTPESFRRFRADSFAYWRTELEAMQAESDSEDDVMRASREQLIAHIEYELRLAGVERDQIPKRPNSWGPNMRQRCDALGEGWIYRSFISSHHNYVHPSWHEISALHLRSKGDVFWLDLEFAGMTPVAGYVLARAACEAASDAADFLPNDLDPNDVEQRLQATVSASESLVLEFSDYYARGGFDRERTEAGRPASDAA